MDVDLTDPQAEFVLSNAKYPAFVGGFGSGKTEALIIRRLHALLSNPGHDYAFYEPTYDLIRMIAWPRFTEILDSLKLKYKLIKHPENRLIVPNYGQIIFRSMDTPGRIIGYEVADSDLDELDTLKPDDAAHVWRMALARNRQKKKGANTMAVATTPEGFGFVYKTWQQAPANGYEIIKAPTDSNPNLPDGYIDSLKDIYPEHLLKAYLEGEFVNLTTGTVYVNFSRTNNGTNEQIKKGEPLYVGMDFNVGNMAAVVHVKRDGKPFAVGEVAKAYDTPDMCRIIKDRYTDHDVMIYPDASGSSTKSTDASKSDIKILMDAGFKVRAKRKNPPVRDRVNSMNAMFQKGYKVNLDSCPNYVQSLEQQTYSANGDPDKTTGLDHHVDAAGYFIEHDYGINRPILMESHVVGLY